MKKLIGLIIVAGLLLVGCTTSTPPEAPTPSPELYDKVWISPGKVMVGNFQPGARAEYAVTIHNGKDQSTQFSVSYKEPGTPEEGFVVGPEEVQAWVIIADPAPVLAPKETRDVLIAVEMPEDATAPENWEFWIAVKDETQTTMVQTELACRWLVSAAPTPTPINWWLIGGTIAALAVIAIIGYLFRARLANLLSSKTKSSKTRPRKRR